MFATPIHWVAGVEPHRLGLMARPRGGEDLRAEVEAWRLKGRRGGVVARAFGGTRAGAAGAGNALRRTWHRVPFLSHPGSRHASLSARAVGPHRGIARSAAA